MSGMRMRLAGLMERPLGSAGAAIRPAWWTADDAADAHAGANGCQSPEANCLYCKTERCPEGLRRCRTCAAWASADGATGVCERGPAGAAGDEPGTRAGDFCRHWRARG